MKVAFSFCIYGDLKKYCQGLVENLEMINEHYPDYYIYIYIYDNVPSQYIEQYQKYHNVVLIKSDRYHQPNMFDRFFLLEDEPTIDIMIVRDTDSRVHQRDRFCIDHFIRSKFLCHTIRDHGYHHAHIMGGLWGLKRNNFVQLKLLYKQYEKEQQNPNYLQYRYDMNFLSSYFYKYIYDSLIVYTFHPGLRISNVEEIYIIPYPVKKKDFCGQVIYYNNEDQPIKEFNHP